MPLFVCLAVTVMHSVSTWWRCAAKGALPEIAIEVLSTASSALGMLITISSLVRERYRSVKTALSPGLNNAPPVRFLLEYSLTSEPRHVNREFETMIGAVAR